MVWSVEDGSGWLGQWAPGGKRETALQSRRRIEDSGVDISGKRQLADKLQRIETPPTLARLRKRSESEDDQHGALLDNDRKGHPVQDFFAEHSKTAQANGRTYFAPDTPIQEDDDDNASINSELSNPNSLVACQNSTSEMRSFLERRRDGFSNSDSESQCSELSNPNSLIVNQVSGSGYENISEEKKRDLLDQFDVVPDDVVVETDSKPIGFPTGVFVNDLPDSSALQKIVFSVNRRKKSGPGCGKRVIVNGTPIALFRYGQKIFAIYDVCFHQGHSLWRGDIEDLNFREEQSGSGTVSRHKKAIVNSIPCVVCPAHKYRFRLEDGHCLTRAGERQEVYPTKIVRGEIFVFFTSINDQVFVSDEF